MRIVNSVEEKKHWTDNEMVLAVTQRTRSLKIYRINQLKKLEMI